MIYLFLIIFVRLICWLYSYLNCFSFSSLLGDNCDIWRVDHQFAVFCYFNVSIFEGDLYFLLTHILLRRMPGRQPSCWEWRNHWRPRRWRRMILLEYVWHCIIYNFFMVVLHCVIIWLLTLIFACLDNGINQSENACNWIVVVLVLDFVLNCIQNFSK